MKKKKNNTRREKIKLKIRKRISGTPDKPRLVVFRSLNHIYAQLIDDVNHRTLLSVCSVNKGVQATMSKEKTKINKSKILGKLIAEKAKSEKIETIVFDRNGYLYHGRVKAVADGAREGGLKF